MTPGSTIRRIGIAGAGLLGRTLAYQLSRQNFDVSLFDSDTQDGKASCGFTGAGMLAPYSELETCPQLVFELGRESLSLWAEIVRTLPSPVFTQERGTLVVAHAQDRMLLARMKRMLQRKFPLRSGSSIEGSANDCTWLKSISETELEICEPGLSERFGNALYLPLEGQIDNRQLLIALGKGLAQSNVECHFQTHIRSIGPGSLQSDRAKLNFDLVIDCRGLGAREDLTSLRGVRGELIEVVAPAVRLTRPVRLLHPRYPLYIVPRQENRYLIGATTIESDDRRPITVQSTLELLSAAYSIDPAFAEAHIAEFRVNCRPALPDNAPLIMHQAGLLQVNGLYRHGFLITPKLVQLISQFIQSGEPDPLFQTLFTRKEILSCISR